MRHRRLALALIALIALFGCAIDHPYDDPGRDECARQMGHGQISPNCPHSR